MLIRKFLLGAVCTVGMVLITSVQGFAQDGDAPSNVYLQVDCMKSTSSDYSDLETEIWQPMHQAMVDAGLKQSWAFYWVMYGDRTECDYYTVNTYSGLDQLNSNVSYGDIFAKVHPNKDLGEAFGKTDASREMIRTELWVMVDGIVPEDFEYAIVNQMAANDPANYVKMEREVFMPVHQASVNAGNRAGWALYRLVAPYGGTMAYNFGTVDFTNKIGPERAGPLWEQVHPDMEQSTAWDMADEARTLVGNATWVKLAQTGSK